MRSSLVDTLKYKIAGEFCCVVFLLSLMDIRITIVRGFSNA